MFCSKCGVQNPDDGVYCTSCGQKLSEPVSVQPPRRSRKSGENVAIIVAIAGCGCLLLIIPILAAILFPVFSRARDEARTANCISNLKQIGTAMMMYANDYNDVWPSKENWCDALKPYAHKTTVFECPALPGMKGGYACNALLSKWTTNDIKSPEATILAFDARGGWNMAGGIELVAMRHRGMANAVFANGQSMPLRSFDMVVWSPSAQAPQAAQPLP